MMTSFLVSLVKSERILAITYCYTLLYCTIVHTTGLPAMLSAIHGMLFSRDIYVSLADRKHRYPGQVVLK